MASAATLDQATATWARQQPPLVKLSPPKLPLDVVHLILQQGSAVESHVCGHPLDEREDKPRVAFLRTAALVHSDWTALANGLLREHVHLKTPRQFARFILGGVYHRTVSLRLGHLDYCEEEPDKLDGAFAELVLPKFTNLRHLTLANISQFEGRLLGLPSLSRLKTLVLRQSVTILSGPPTPLLPFRLQHLVYEGPDDGELDADLAWTDALLLVVDALLNCVEDSLVITIDQPPRTHFPTHPRPSPLKSLDIISYDTFDVTRPSSPSYGGATLWRPFDLDLWIHSSFEPYPTPCVC